MVEKERYTSMEIIQKYYSKTGEKREKESRDRKQKKKERGIYWF